MSKRIKFKIDVDMPERWVPHFLSMLKYMEHLGSLGGSRKVCLYSDGDGDFNPKFNWHSSLNDKAEPVQDDNGDRLYDAG